MPISLTDINDIWDILAVSIVVVISTIGTLGAAAVPLIIKQRAHNRAVTATLGAVRDNVQNGHQEPMREDLDRALSKLDSVIDKIDTVDDRTRDLSRDIGGLREELRTERIERIEGDKRRHL